MKLPKRFPLIILISAVTLILAVILILIFSGINKTEEFNALIEDADRQIGNKTYGEAVSVLKRSFRLADDSLSWLMILKRCRLIGARTRDYYLFSEAAGKALEDLSGREDIRFCSIYADILTGAYQEALLKGQKFSGGTDIYNTLIAEAVIRDNPSALIDDFPIKEPDLLLRAVNSREPYLMESAAETYDNTRLYMDAALLRMHAGNFDKAFAISDSYLRETYPELFVLIAFDSENFPAVDDFLSQNGRSEFPEDICLLLGESRLNLDKYSAAFDFYSGLIHTDPDLSWIPYLNLSWLSRKMEKSGEEDYLHRGLSVFPGNQYLTLALVSFYIAEHHTAKARDLLKDFIGSNPDNTAARLLFLKLSDINNKPRYSAGLWKIFNEDPANPMTARFFLWYTAGIGDIKSARQILDRYEGEIGEWIDFYNALAYAGEDDLKSAGEYFKSSFNQKQRWETIYNSGIIYFAENDYQNAAEAFRNAEMILSTSGNPSYSRARQGLIRIKLGHVLLKMNDPAGAGREISFGLELDPDNLEGTLLLKQLDNLNSER